MSGSYPRPARGRYDRERRGEAPPPGTASPRAAIVAAPAARTRNLTVCYGATLAVDAVDMEFLPGEIHALVGENGAGKSTLLRALAGAAPISAGSVEIAAGERVAWVPQETDLPTELTAAEWIFLGAEMRGPIGWLRRGDMAAEAEQALRHAGCTAPAGARLGDLSLAQRKQVQFARALRENPDLLLIDEPTAVLGDAETAALFATLRKLRSQGAAVVYVSHHLDEVMALADRVSVLRDGRKVATSLRRDVDIALLVHQMVGRAVEVAGPSARQRGAVVLRVSGLAVDHVEDVSFTVRAGEIVGLAGLVGAGRSEVLEAIAGLRRRRAGDVESSVRPVLLPEDRGLKGLVQALNLRENLFLPADSWLVGGGAERRLAQAWLDRLRIRAGSSEAGVDTLSGGNQQKLLLARSLRRGSPLLLLDEPTAGVDVGAKAEIHEFIRRQAEEGAAVLVASSDLPELLHLCDRIIAMRLGRVVGTVDHPDAAEARLGAMITGGHEHGAGAG